MKYPRIVKGSTYGRVYEVEENLFFGSVTTILKYGLPTPEWLFKYHIKTSGGDYDKYLRHSGEASEIGTAVHTLAERVISGEVVEISDNPLDYVSGKGYYPTDYTLVQIRKGLQSFMAFWDHNKPKVEAVEQMMFNTEQCEGNYMFPFAGKCDLICTIFNKKKEKPERWLLDIKTSVSIDNSLNFQLQLSMYTAIHNQNNPDRKIDRMGILWAKKDFKKTNPPLAVLTPKEYKYRPDLIKPVYTLFQELYNGFELGKPKVKESTPKVFSLQV